MQVRLLLADDTELRQAVKELIEAEVKSVARAEIQAIIKEAVGEKTAPYVAPIVRAEVEKVVKDWLQKEKWDKAEMRAIAKEIIYEAVKEWYAKNPTPLFE